VNNMNEFRIEQSSLIQALEHYREMETVLEEERENLQNIISQESSKWQGEAAEVAVSSMNSFLQTGEYNEAYECVRKVRLCMEDTLDQVSALLVRCEDFPKQLESDTYIESMRPACGDYTLRNGGVLYLDYGKAMVIPDLCDQISEAAEYLGTVLKQSMEDCRGIIDDIDGYQNRVDEAVRKVKRVENYKLSFQKYVQGIKALENDVAVCLAGMKDEPGVDVSTMEESDSIERDITRISEAKKYDVAEEILRRYLTKLGMDPVEQNMLIEILREKNPNMLSTLYAVSRYSSADMDDVLEEIINYYNSNLECKMLSSDGIYKLRDIELAEYQISDLCVLDDEGEIIGIWPYYVMINAGNGTHYNDGGITIGYGHHINAEEWKLVDGEEHVLLSQYVPEDVIISGIVVNNSELTLSGNVLVDGANYVPIDEANQILAEDIIYHSNEVADFLEENGIEVTQGQFDALVIYRFNRGHLSQTAIDYLREGNMSEEDWRAVWTGGEEREKLCQELFFGTEG